MSPLFVFDAYSELTACISDSVGKTATARGRYHSTIYCNTVTHAGMHYKDHDHQDEQQIPLHMYIQYMRTPSIQVRMGHSASIHVYIDVHIY